MKRKRSYTTADVDKFDVFSVLPGLGKGCIVGIDVAKTKFVFSLANAAGETQKLVRFEHPKQTGAFLGVVTTLRDQGLEPHVVMEPTGTYGDAIRYQCHRLGVPVHMMPPKYTHDFAEVFDGVASTHDPKAAAMLARLHAMKPVPEWKPKTEAERDLRAQMDRRWPLVKFSSILHGEIEAILARHWPEFWASFDAHTQRSWMTLLKEFPGPGEVAAAAEKAAETLHRAARGRLSTTHIADVIAGARDTYGVPMTERERVKLRELVEQLIEQTHRLDQVDAEIAVSVSQHEQARPMAEVVGPACAASIVSYIGLPTEIASAGAMEKAAGLNLKERSSGEKKGRLSITKRGAAPVRQLLYLAALRLINSNPVVAAWYRARGAYKGGRKIAAVVAVMRKLIRALWHIAKGKEPFDAAKLFDKRRLNLPDETAKAESPSTCIHEANAASPPARRGFARPRSNKGGVTQPVA